MQFCPSMILLKQIFSMMWTNLAFRFCKHLFLENGRTLWNSKKNYFRVSTLLVLINICLCSSDFGLGCLFFVFNFLFFAKSYKTVNWNINSNRIRFIPIDGFKHTPHIRTVDLTDNLLGKNGIPSGAFLPLRHLEFLFLSDNSLEEVPKHLPITLRSLYLSGKFAHVFGNDRIPPIVSWDQQKYIPFNCLHFKTIHVLVRFSLNLIFRR